MDVQKYEIDLCVDALLHVCLPFVLGQDWCLCWGQAYIKYMGLGMQGQASRAQGHNLGVGPSPTNVSLNDAAIKTYNNTVDLHKWKFVPSQRSCIHEVFDIDQDISHTSEQSYCNK